MALSGTTCILKFRKDPSGWAMVVHSFNSSTREAGAGGYLLVQGQPGLQELVPGQAPKATEKPCLEKPKKK